MIDEDRRKQLQKEAEEAKRIWDESSFWEKAERITWSLIILPFWIAGWIILFCWPSFLLCFVIYWFFIR